MIERAQRASILSRSHTERSLDFLQSIQLSSGMIPWFSGGRADPWNHSECAIALALGGRLNSARHAADWLLRSQNSDGSWCHFYQSQGVAEPRRDTNTCCYPVVLAAVLDFGADGEFDSLPYVNMALSGIEFVLNFQNDDGSIPWAIDPSGVPYRDSLVAASASIYDSLLIASQLQEKYGFKMKTDILGAAEALKSSIEDCGARYKDTSNWAMDWYYPVLAGLRADQNLTTTFLDRFYSVNWGIRCLGNGDWFTTAETAESAIAMHISGEVALSLELFSTISKMRTADGGFLTGLVAPSGASFPAEEKSAYSVAAVLIANFILAQKPTGSFSEAVISFFS